MAGLYTTKTGLLQVEQETLPFFALFLLYNYKRIKEA